MDGERDYAVASTQWLVGQYLAWTEILRQEIQFLNLGAAEKNLQLVRLQHEVSASFATDRGDVARPLRLWRSDQRGVGELMITRSDDERQSLGYAGFVEKMGSDRLLRHWMESLHVERLQNPRERTRAVRIQRGLIDLIDFLDEDRSRYPLDLRGKLPLGDTLPAREAAALIESSKSEPPIARFRYGVSPRQAVEDWAEAYAWTWVTSGVTDDEIETHAISHHPTVFGTGADVTVEWEPPTSDARSAAGWVTIDARVTESKLARRLRWPRPRALLAPGHLRGRSRRKRLAEINVLLRMFDRPLLRRQ